jgi:ribonuclease R
LPEPVREVSGGEHFRLASRRLVPWTSPLGRHAELLAQRVIVAALEQEAQGRRLVQGAEEEAQLARDLAQATALERRAVAVEREALALHRAWLLRQRVGETLEGQVTGVTSDGVVVTTSAPFAEVQVRADALGRERYELDGQAPRFHARQGGDSVGLGDRVAVTIEEVVVCRRHVSGWRHTPDMADRAPLRHAPFRPATKKRATGKRSRR